jgi:hypothetical protein
VPGVDVVVRGMKGRGIGVLVGVDGVISGGLMGRGGVGSRGVGEVTVVVSGRRLPTKRVHNLLPCCVAGQVERSCDKRCKC